MDATREKKSATEPLKFRPGPKLGSLIDGLLGELRKREPSLEFSATLRDVLQAFWPQIEAYLIARQQTKADPATLCQLVLICAKAQEMGVTPAQVEQSLATLIEQRLAI